MAALSILFRDQHFVAVDKPAGLLVHRSWISADTEFLLQRLRDQIGQRVYPVHRLDRPTSGTLVFGLSSEAAAKLCATFEGRGVAKRYLAVVRGYVEGAGEVDYPLHEDPDKPELPALTRYRGLAQVELPFAVSRYPTTRYSLVEALPETGRMHQIRRHFAHLRHPIIGDTSHGEGRHNRFFRERFGIERLLLHADTLRFIHPYTGADTEIRAPLPEEFAALCDRFGWPHPGPAHYAIGDSGPAWV